MRQEVLNPAAFNFYHNSKNKGAVERKNSIALFYPEMRKESGSVVESTRD